MTRVLIAVDDAPRSIEAAKTAHRLFGDEAEYLVVHVGSVAPVGGEWGRVHPVAMPLTVPIPILPLGGPITPVPDTMASSGPIVDPISDAEQRAEQIAAAAHVSAEPVGGIGDPAEAILDAARVHAVDVIVVGSHDRNWFGRLFTRSVSNTVVREAEIPVLVARPGVEMDRPPG